MSTAPELNALQNALRHISRTAKDRTEDARHRIDTIIEMADGALSASPSDTGVASMPANARWCQPGDMQGERRYLVRFDDPDCNDAVFTDWDKARTFYAKATLSWNCWLFAAVPADAIASPVPQGEAEPASHGVVTDAMVEDACAAHWGEWPRDRSEVRLASARRDMRAALSAALAPALQGVESQAISDIAAERKRQIEAEGWTPEHDDTHKLGELAAAAACYAASAKGHGFILLDRAPSRWPWSLDWWKPTSQRRDLIKAGALIAAEIDRLDRAAAPEQEKSNG